MKNNFIKEYIKVIGYFLFIILFLLPNLSIAANKCSKYGYTVATINGINTNELEAKSNMIALDKILGFTQKDESINYQYFYNPTHGQIFDALDTANQIYFDQDSFNIEDADFANMLTDASAKLTTQKVLLVSHSQGNFYANTFYDAVADEPGGVPSMSIGVYGVATPASRVAGGGLYLTSDTDEMIIGTVAQFPLTNVLKSNIHINLNANDDPLGHDFSKIYLAYAGDRIVSDIKTSLDKLQNNNIQKENEGCIVPPKLTITQKIQGGVLAFVDPVSIPVQAITVNVAIGTYQVATAIGNSVLNGITTLASGVSSLAQSIFNNARNLAANNNTATAINAIEPSASTTEAPQNSTPETAKEKPKQVEKSSTPENVPAKSSTPISITRAEALPPPQNNIPTVVATSHGVTGTSSVSQAESETIQDENPVAPEPEPEPPAEENPIQPVADRIPPIISSLTLTPNSGSVGVGGTVTLTITADASNYVAGEIKMNNVMMTGFANIGNNNYTATYTVAQGDANRASGTVPVGVVLVDVAGNANTAYTTVATNNLVINGQISNSAIQVFPSFLSNGRFREDVILNCNPNGTDISTMYFVSDSGEYHFMNGGTNSISCPRGHQIFISKDSSFADFSGYQAGVGWYYFSIFPNGNQNTPSTFIRLHRNSAGIWSNSDVPPHGNIPTITTPAQAVNTDSITITGTALPNSIIAITGGMSVATGIATGGNYAIPVVLNQNTINDLSVTATDGAGNTSSEATVLITHDNIPPVISSVVGGGGPANVVLVGRTFSIIITADAPNYTINEFTINGIPATNIHESGTNYIGEHTVALGETDRSSGSVPVSIVLTDPAGNSNIAYTTPVGNDIIINGHYPVSVTQVAPTFDSNGKFTQDVVLPCITSSGYAEMYYIRDADSTFRVMNSASDSPYTVSCPNDHKTIISSGSSFEYFTGYREEVGWYYSAISIGDPKCDLYANDKVCVNDNVQSFVRLHRDVAGVWSDSDVIQ